MEQVLELKNIHYAYHNLEGETPAVTDISFCLGQKEGKVPRLLLHSCCAPCSSYVLEYLSQYFEITVFYYNPNIYPESEYTKRILEQQTLIASRSRSTWPHS